MHKITLFFLIAFIGAVCADHCDSCGGECSSACGTRRFRTCCFNYLRRKRTQDQQWLDLPEAASDKVRIFVKSLPASWPQEVEKYLAEDANRFHNVYD